MEETSWRAPVWLYPSLLLASAFTLLLRASIFSKPGRFSTSFVGFQRRFLLAFFLALAADGLQNVYSEALYRSYGVQRSQTAVLIFAGHGAALLIGTTLAFYADVLGRKKICCSYAVFVTLESLFKHSTRLHSLYAARLCNGLASTLIYCVFESWMISEHEKYGFPSEWLGDTFWIMTFGGAVVSVASTATANFFVSSLNFSLSAPSSLAALSAIACTVVISTLWMENVNDTQGRRLRLGDKRLVTLGLVQASFDVSVSVFWLLWIPTIAADGREFHAASIYVALLACVMLGSTISAILLSSSPNLSLETILLPVFIVAGFCLMVPAYDYQEISTLVAAFCVFHICVGLATPLLARIRSMSVSSSYRAGTYALFQAPTKVLLSVFLIQGSKLRALSNDTILYFCSFSLLAAAGGLHFLNVWRSRQPGLPVYN